MHPNIRILVPLLILQLLTQTVNCNDDKYEKCSSTDCSSKTACVTIYQHADFKGWYQCQTLQDNDCITLNSWWSAGRVSSVESHSTCVRLHALQGCKGDSLEIKPGSSHTDLKTSNFDNNVFSVSSCKRPANHNACHTSFLFGKSIKTANVSKASTDILRGLEIIGSIAVAAFSEAVPGLDVVVAGITFIAGLFNTETCEKILVEAKIDAAIARTSASQISAKMHVIEDKLQGLLSPQTKAQDKRIDVVVARASCEEIRKLFEDRNYPFSQNKIVASPFLVGFSSIYLSVAKIMHELRPDMKKRIVKGIRELETLNIKFMEEVIKKRKEMVGIREKAPCWVCAVQSSIRDRLACDGDQSCKSDETCENKQACETCLKNTRDSIDTEIKAFFIPVINKLKEFPNGKKHGKSS